MKHTRVRRGFTIVELLIVIVVIAILAAITIVAYNGIQARARDAERQTDIAAMRKAIEAYYVDHSTYPYHVDFTGNTAAKATWAKTNLMGVNDGVLINPAAPSGTLNSWTAGGTGITSAQYTYYSYKDTTTICSATDDCPGGYLIGWRDDAGNYRSQLYRP